MRTTRIAQWCLIATLFAMFTGMLLAANVRYRHPAVKPRSEAVREAVDPDDPMEAIRWRRLSEVDENGRIARGAWARAVRQREINADAASRSKATQTLPWIERSPTNVTGRSRAFVIHPTNPKRMWTGGVGGGIWYSSNGGVTWKPTDDKMASLAIGCLTMDPTNPDILYAGTGEGYFNGDAINGAGLFKSTDGGVTWNQLANTTSFNAINRVAVSPANDNILLMTTQYGGINRSTDGGMTWTTAMWTQVGMGVEFNPANPTQVIATALDYDFTQNNWFSEALYSTDSGQTWHAATGDVGKIWGFNSRIEVAYAPSNPSIVYASAAINGGVVYKSTDGGQSYLPMTTSGNSEVSWYNNAIWVDPTNPNFVVVCGTNTFKSTNGGVTLTQIGSGYILTTQPHPDDHFIVAMPGFDGVHNKTLFITSDGGPFRTNNIYAASESSGWAPVGVQLTTQYYGAAGDGPSGRILGGLQDNGTLLTESGNNASLEFGGDGGFCAIDWTDPQYMYGEYIDLQIHRSTNGGSNADWITDGLSDAGSNANFIAPFILDPNNVNRLVAGGSSLWACNNAKGATPTWSAIRSSGSALISAVAVAPGNSDVIWVGQNDGGVYKTANGSSAAPTWTTVNANGGTNPLPNRYITRILIDSAKSNTVYVALGGFTSGNLWKTTDGGTTWQNITGSGATGLPNAPIRGIARDPINAKSLFVGTEVGIFSSTNGGATWATSNLGPVNVSVDELTFMANSSTLLAATHGRGIWTAELNKVTKLSIVPTTQVGGSSLTATVTVARLAPAGGINVTLTSSNTAVVKPHATITVPAGKTTVTFNIPTAAVAAATKVKVTAALGAGQASATVTITP